MQNKRNSIAYAHKLRPYCITPSVVSHLKQRYITLTI